LPLPAALIITATHLDLEADAALVVRRVPSPSLEQIGARRGWDKEGATLSIDRQRLSVDLKLQAGDPSVILSV